MTSYYETLGVPRDADIKTIRQAYRRFARRHHPDLNPGDAEAEARFKRANEAYGVLSDPEKRAKYDKYGDKWQYAEQFEARRREGAGTPFGRASRTSVADDPLMGAFGFGHFDDLSDLLGGRGSSGRRRRTGVAIVDVESRIALTLEEAYAGTRRMVTVSGPGAERRLEVTIPPGVDTGSVVRITLDGDQRLLLTVEVTPHSRLERKGADLFVEAQVPLADALLGGEVDVDTLGGRVRLKVPPESQNGQRIRLAGKGMPVLGKPGVKGDLFVILRPRLPQKLSDRERELVRELARIRDGAR